MSDTAQFTFTVFTPSYNAAATLPGVYGCLREQTFRDFEWLIVDDGSTDDTESLVAGWIDRGEFPIRYVRQPNRGKHLAINRGVAEARGELFLTLDADDLCVPQALERFKFHWDSVPPAERERFSAVTSLCQDEQGRVIGDRFPFDPTDSDSLEIYYRYGVRGEKWGFHRTDVLRQFPFEDIGDKWIEEGVIWKRIARRYKTRYVNEPLRIYRRTFSGITKASPAKYAAGHAYSHRLTLNEDLGWFFRRPIFFARIGVHFVRYSLHAGVGPLAQLGQLETAGGKLLWLACAPLGGLVYLRDRWRDRRAA